LEVEQRELNGGVLGSRQEVQRVLEVVVDEHRLQDDHRHDDRPQHRENDPEEDLHGSGPVDDRGFVQFSRNRRDEGAEQQDAERESVGDFDQDQARHGFEEPECLQDPDGWYDGGWDD
jgi:hypothetical protein